MYVVAVPDPACAGCLGDGRCWVCLGTGRFSYARRPDVGCHVCWGTGGCAICPVMVDIVSAERSVHLNVSVRG
jgi:hypothetical protein